MKLLEESIEGGWSSLLWSKLHHHKNTRDKGKKVSITPKQRKQPMKREEMLVNHISNKALVSEMYKDSKDSIRK